MHSNRGIYALLLGSGVSRASGIPTGWEIVIDLIRKVAKLKGQNCEPDPVKWFQETQGRTPNYSQLLDALAGTQAERQRLLRGYFEPTDEEQKDGQKLPSRCHHAIAKLVANGYVRVILTTNFDRLTETALHAIGLQPTVISTTDQLAGALPLSHAGPTVIKLNGDYRDTRIKNTEGELDTYDAEWNKMLDRIFDEYGLIICGWSADWDTALRAAMERCPSRRFTTFWASRSVLSGTAIQLLERRNAVKLIISDADSFFEELQQKLASLEDLSSPHPLSPKLAAATVKRLLVDPTAKIKLHDLVQNETEKLLNESQLITSSPLPPKFELNEELIRRMKKCEAASEVLVSVLVTGCFWGEHNQSQVWAAALQRLANPSREEVPDEMFEGLPLYPALLGLYAAGVAAVAARNFSTLQTLFTEPTLRNRHGKKEPMIFEINANGVIEGKAARALYAPQVPFTPLSNYLFTCIREPLKPFVAQDDEYQEAFDRFEYLLSLTYADLRRSDCQDGWMGPIGCYAWRGRYFPDSQLMHTIGEEFENAGDEWGPIAGGLFGGSREQFKNAKSKCDAFLKLFVQDWH